MLLGVEDQTAVGATRIWEVEGVTVSGTVTVGPQTPPQFINRGILRFNAVVGSFSVLLPQPVASAPSRRLAGPGAVLLEARPARFPVVLVHGLAGRRIQRDRTAQLRRTSQVDRAPGSAQGVLSAIRWA
jgi:hypothetical protein